MRLFLLFLVPVIVAGCKQNPELPAVISPYKIDIQQGNVVTQEMVAKLKVGQTRSQVRFVLGSPLVTDAFHPDRWDYVFSLQRQGKSDERRRLTVIFEADKLVRIEGDVVPTDGTQETEKPVAKPAAAPAPSPPVAEKPAAPKAEPAKPVAKAAEKPAAKPPVAVAPAAKSAEKPAEKPPVIVAPAEKPVAAATAQPAPSKAETVTTNTAKPAAADKPAASKPAATTVAAGGVTTPSADAAKPESAKSDSAPAAARADEKKDKPNDKGVFGRMMDKIGF